MTVTPTDLLIWLAVAAPALIAIGVLGEYVAAAIHHGHHGHKKGHR
jgi:hypothetical protein